MTRSSSRVARGEEDHRDEVARGAQPAADLEAVDVGEHDVEDDEVGRGARRRVERVAAAGRRRDAVAHVAERGGEQVGDRGLVVDDEDVRGTSAGGVHGRISRSGTESFL